MSGSDLEAAEGMNPENMEDEENGPVPATKLNGGEIHNEEGDDKMEMDD